MTRSLLVLLVTLPAIASAQAPAPAPTLTRHTSAHYHLLTDLTDAKQLKTVQAFLEGCHKTFVDLIAAKKPVRKLPRPVVRVFRHKADYAQYGKQDTALRFNANWRGYYARPRNELISYLGKQPLSDLCSILSHEGFHQFAWRYVVRPGSDRLPDWFEEGLADYLRSPRLGKDGKLALVTKPKHLRRLKAAIKAGTQLPWQKLWKTDPATLANKDEFEAFYAHAYGLARFLMEQGGKGRVKKVFRLKREGVFNADLLLRVFPPEQRAGLHRAFLRYAHLLGKTKGGKESEKKGEKKSEK